MKCDTMKQTAMQTKRQLYWKRIMEDWRDSKLSSTEYCNRHKIGQSAFYKWKDKLGYKRSLKSQKKPAYVSTSKGSNGKLPSFVNVNLLHDDVSINLGKEKTFPVEVELILKNGRNVKLSCPNYGSEVAQLLTILEGLPC